MGICDGRVVIVTGAGRGLGRDYALAFAAEGAKVVVNDLGGAVAGGGRDQSAADSVVEEIRKAGGEAIANHDDVADWDGAGRMVADAVEAFGRLDTVVNNAGILKVLPFVEHTLELWDATIRVHLRGHYCVIRQAVDYWRAQRAAGNPIDARVVNITSISAYTASVNRGDYCIAKAGLAMMTKLFAARLAEYGIGVYEIRPGVIETDMTGAVKEKYDKLFAGGLTPINRWGRPDDIGRAVAALASGAFPYSTGEVLNVDGGFHLRVL